MTRKDFVLIAKTIKSARPDKGSPADEREGLPVDVDLARRCGEAEAQRDELVAALESFSRWLALNEQVHNGPDHQPLSFPLTYGEARRIGRALARTPAQSAARYRAIYDCLAKDFAAALAGTNPNFKRERFLTACGVTEGN